MTFRRTRGSPGLCGWMQLDDLNFADDLALLSDTHEKNAVQIISVSAVGLKIHKRKTKILKYNRENTDPTTLDDSIIDGQGGFDDSVNARTDRAGTVLQTRRGGDRASDHHLVLKKHWTTGGTTTLNNRFQALQGIKGTITSTCQEKTTINNSRKTTKKGAGRIHRSNKQRLVGKHMEHFEEILNKPAPLNPPHVKTAHTDLPRDSREAARPDNIPAKSLKKILEEEQVTTDWKEGVLLNRMDDSIDAQLQYQQAEFRKDRSCTYQIATLQIIVATNTLDGETLEENIKAMISTVRTIFIQLKNIWNSKRMPVNIKVRIFITNVEIVLLYGVETIIKNAQVFIDNCLPRKRQVLVGGLCSSMRGNRRK
ncbi:uncharacterized protein DC041_0001584 [Schistosoma bovis]|uniref:DUF6451 domain-containing protein n=1 Tax=Schistosoma bovis TaxID=6184 RepID=A0A430QG08_SCHBO|nr:uncharacterized protein DC041_0001584 [Schistosoma bovis]